MRLINTRSLRLEGPFLPADIPSYAITWGADELCHQDMTDLRRHRNRNRRGYKKIQRFCQRALKDGHEYGWVDTVCIDKTSSAELSEAINSMYKWYAKSAVCYAVLEDLDLPGELITLQSLRTCRYWTRGWALQELIAPTEVLFLNAQWIDVGSKTGADYKFTYLVAQVTGVDLFVLRGLSVKRLSIATRISWAAKRQTSRPEDLAYSLLGLFGVAMPLLYGEGGDRAFIRLQEEILQAYPDDHTIFAWSADVAEKSFGSVVLGLLAPTPACFRLEDHYIPIRTGESSNSDVTITSRGVHLKARMNESCTELILNCRLAKTSNMLCTIPIVRLRSGPSNFARGIYPPTPGLVPLGEYSNLTDIYVRTDIHEADIHERHLIDYMEIVRVPDVKSGYSIASFHPMEMYHPESRIIHTSLFPNTPCGAVLVFQQESFPRKPSFAVAMFGVSTEDGVDSVHDDFVGAYKTDKNATDFYMRDFESWFSGMPVKSPEALKVISVGGVSGWMLDRTTFIHVIVDRDRDRCMSSIAVAEILVEDISEPVESDDEEDGDRS